MARLVEDLQVYGFIYKITNMKYILREDQEPENYYQDARLFLKHLSKIQDAKKWLSYIEPSHPLHALTANCSLFVSFKDQTPLEILENVNTLIVLLGGKIHNPFGSKKLFWFSL